MSGKTIYSTEMTVTVPTYDLLQNSATGLGTSADKDYYNKFVHSPVIDVDEIDALYSNDWLAAKIVDALPHDMVRSWRTIEGLTAEELTSFENEIKNFDIKVKIEEGLKDARKYGGAALFLNVKGQGSVRTELDIYSVNKGDLLSIVSFDATELKVHKIEDDIFNPNYGNPKFYALKKDSANEVVIHHSRIIRFQGIKVPRKRAKLYNYWGASLYQRTREALARAATAYGAGSNLLHEASLDIISIEGFTNLLGDPIGESQILKRMTLANLTKSNQNMLIKDKEEDFTKITQNFAGIPDVIREYVIALSGASDIPVTRLLGLSPSGLNATGEHDLINYYDTINSRQNLELSPILDKIDVLLMRNIFGDVKEGYSYSYNSLWQPTRGQIVDMLKKSVEAYNEAMEYLPPVVVLRAIKRTPHFDITDEEIAEWVSVLEKRIADGEKKDKKPENTDE